MRKILLALTVATAITSTASAQMNLVPTFTPPTQSVHPPVYTAPPVFMPPQPTAPTEIPTYDQQMYDPQYTVPDNTVVCERNMYGQLVCQ